MKVRVGSDFFVWDRICKVGWVSVEDIIFIV